MEDIMQNTQEHKKSHYMRVPDEDYNIVTNTDESKIRIILNSEAVELLEDLEPGLWEQPWKLERFFKGSDVFKFTQYGIVFTSDSHKLGLMFQASESDVIELAKPMQMVQSTEQIMIFALDMPEKVVLELIITLPEGEKLVYSGTHKFPEKSSNN